MKISNSWQIHYKFSLSLFFLDKQDVDSVIVEVQVEKTKVNILFIYFYFILFWNENENVRKLYRFYIHFECLHVTT